MDKKVVEEEVCKVKDNIGCVIFESGKWKDEDEFGFDDDDDDVWNLEKL